MQCYGNRLWRRPPKGISNTCKTKLLHMQQDINISVVCAMWQTYAVTPPLQWQQCVPTPLFTAEGEDMPHIPHSSRSSCCHVRPAGKPAPAVVSAPRSHVGASAAVSPSTCVLVWWPDPSVGAVVTNGLGHSESTVGLIKLLCFFSASQNHSSVQNSCFCSAPEPNYHSSIVSNYSPAAWSKVESQLMLEMVPVGRAVCNWSIYSSGKQLS